MQIGCSCCCTGCHNTKFRTQKGSPGTQETCFTVGLRSLPRARLSKYRMACKRSSREHVKQRAMTGGNHALVSRLAHLPLRAAAATAATAAAAVAVAAPTAAVVTAVVRTSALLCALRNLK
eukprot:1153277-Pelagomonas_calceolata.AAC.6